MPLTHPAMYPSPMQTKAKTPHVVWSARRNMMATSTSVTGSATAMAAWMAVIRKMNHWCLRRRPTRDGGCVACTSSGMVVTTRRRAWPQYAVQ